MPGGTPGQSTRSAGEEQANSTDSEVIQREIKQLKDFYGQKGGRAARAVPLAEVLQILQRVEQETRKVRVNDASRRVEEAVRIVEKIAGKLEDRWRENGAGKSYAQAARRGAVDVTQGKSLEVAPLAHPREEKRVIVRIPNKAEADALKEQPREEIVQRIQRGIGAEYTDRRVIAVRKLRSGDLAIHTDSVAAKQNMERETSWATEIAPGAVVRKRTWPVIIHGVRVADYSLNDEETAKRIEKENARIHPELRIMGTRWLGRATGKAFAPLVIEAETTEQANRLISEGVVMTFDLKLAERYDPKCRITQCFKCQRYGHISSACTREQRCGHCGGKHTTEACANEPKAVRKSCAACEGGEHTSWSPACPARDREASRAKYVRRTMPKLYPVSANEVPQTRNRVSETPSPYIRFTGASQANDDWVVVGTKKRRIAQPGRPIGAVGRAKTLEREAGSQSITDFTWTTQSSLGNRHDSETPADSQANIDDLMEQESTTLKE